jgi:hypothetical protein
MGMYTMKFHEVCKYFLNPPLMPVNHGTILVNKKAWDSLPDDLKQMLELGFIKAGLDMTNNQNFTGEQWGLNVMQKKHGVKINTLTGEDLKRAHQVAYQIWDEEAKKSPSCAELVQKIKDYMKTMGHMAEERPRPEFRRALRWVPILEGPDRANPIPPKTDSRHFSLRTDNPGKRFHLGLCLPWD